MKKILIIGLVIALSSCDSLLDVDSVNNVETDVALKTSKDVEALMVSAYNSLGDGDLLGGNLQRDAELIADVDELLWDGTFAEPRQIWNKDILITNTQIEDTWLDGYRTINICNTVLANLDLVSDNKAETVEGEARFIRATMYFELVKVFARTWTDTEGTPATNPGVPIITEPTTLERVPRSSVAEVYALIIEDLTEAKNLLPEVNSFFATTYSASAMLSRVYLMQNDYANAALEANTVIESGEFELIGNGKYETVFNNTARTSDRESNQNATTEDVFAIQVTNQSGINNLNTFYATSDFGGRGDIYILQPHIDLYEEDDERLEMFYDYDEEEGIANTGKFTNRFGNVPVIRLAEMYLTRAEANFREGTSVGATPLEDVNTIRNRVGLSSLGVVTLDDILHERQLELAFEGQRIHDLKRTQSPVGSLDYNDPSLIYPIPVRERIINPDLEQNEGYGN